MHHKVSEKYITMRRGGPRRLFIMMSSVLALFALLAFFPRNHPDNTSPFGSLVAIAVAVAIGFFQSRRMSKATTELECLTVEVTGDGIALETPGLRQVLSAAQVSKILLYRKVFSPGTYCIGFQIGSRLVVLPPLEQNDAFIAELRLAAPHAQFLVRRKLIV
jgi:hypothetical protein